MRAAPDAELASTTAAAIITHAVFECEADAFSRSCVGRSPLEVSPANIFLYTQVGWALGSI
jgi:hypothetical protein